MRRVLGVAVAGMLLLGAALSGEAWAGGGRVRVHVASPIWWAPGFVPRPFIVYPHHARPYFGPRRYYSPVYGSGPLVYGYAPPIYVPPAAAPQAPPPYGQPQAFAPPPPQYWYFCQEAAAYHPYVNDCPGGWMTVVPPPGSGGGGGAPAGADQD
jgi:hypothetical protein